MLTEMYFLNCTVSFYNKLFPASLGKLFKVKFYVLFHNTVFFRSETHLREAPQFATCFHVGFLPHLFLKPQDGGNTFAQNVSCLSMDYTALYARRWYSSKPSL
jgi:hypothetical protein